MHMNFHSQQDVAIFEKNFNDGKKFLFTNSVASLNRSEFAAKESNNDLIVGVALNDDST